jgi:hypothetical protein
LVDQPNSFFQLNEINFFLKTLLHAEDHPTSVLMYSTPAFLASHSSRKMAVLSIPGVALGNQRMAWGICDATTYRYR